MFRHLKLVALLLICVLAAGCFGSSSNAPKVTPKPGGSDSPSKDEALVVQRLEEILNTPPENFSSVLKYIHEPLKVEVTLSFNGVSACDDELPFNPCEEGEFNHEQVEDELYDFFALKARADDADVDVTFSAILVETFGTRIAARFHATQKLERPDPADPGGDPVPVTITIIHETIWEQKDGEWKMTELLFDIDETED